LHIIILVECVVPENIHTPPTEGLFGLNPHPSGIPVTLCGGGMDIFWSHTMDSNSGAVYMEGKLSS